MAKPKGVFTDDWRDSNRNDPGIALLEAISYVADLLSSYNERIAAEQRLRTRRRYAVALTGLVLILFTWWRSKDGTNDD